MKIIRTPYYLPAVFFLLLDLWLAPAAAAQGFGPGNMKERLATDTDEVIRQLGLSKEETAKVRPILEDRNEKQIDLVEKMRQNGGGGRGGMRQQIDTLNEETDKKLAAVLSEAKMKKYKEMQEAKLAERRNRRGMRRNGN